MLKNITSKFQVSECKWLFRISLIMFFVATFQQAQSQDMGATSLIAPVSPICSANNQTVVVRIKNFDAGTIDYSVDTVIVTVGISGASTQTFIDTLFSGTLAFNATQDITVTSLCDLSVSGTHIFKVYTTILSGDIDALNDTLPVVNITVNPLPPTPTITAYGSTTFCVGGSVLLVSSNTTGNVWTGGTTNDSLTVLTSGPYSVTVTALGCSTASTITTVTANPLPAIPTITAYDTIVFCQGGSVILVSSSATGNLWTGGSTNDSLTVIASGPYSVTVTALGCSSTSAVTTVTVNPLPTVSLAPFTFIPCSQAPAFALTGGLPAGGTYSGIGVTANMFYPGSAGAVQGITYTYTDLNGCSNSASSNLTVHDCTGIEEITSEGIILYPNPATNGLLNISIKNASFYELLISIVDIQGKEVFSASDKNISADFNTQINISHLAKGIYYIKLSKDADVKIQKLIVE